MLQGVYVANVTPFRDDANRTVDLDAYRMHVRWLAGNGVTGVVPFGTNGEGASVSGPEKVRVLESLVEDDPGIEIVPAAMEGNLPDTLDLLERINDLPVSAVLVLPPYYFRPVATAGLRSYYERVLQTCTHPVVAYHIPRYAVPVPAELVASLPLWGVKNSAGDVDYSAAVRAAGKGVLLGTEDDLAGQLPHAEGAISALANIVPEQIVDLFRRVRSAGPGDQAGAERLSAHLRQVRAVTKEYDAPGLLKRIAEARHGTGMGTVRPPLVPVPATYDASAAVARLEPPAA